MLQRWEHDPEFEVGAGELDLAAPSRRELLKVAGVSLAAAVIAQGCGMRPSGEPIVPYVDPPVGRMPGVPVVYASTMPWAPGGGYGRGVLVTTREGRPVKVEGNPDHPSSLGGTDVFMQASVWDLWDPGRVRTPACAGEPASWGSFWREMGGTKGGVAVLTGAVTSPTLVGLLEEMERSGRGRWYVHEPVSRGAVMAGARLSFGRELEPVYEFGSADVVVSLDSDFLFAEPGSVRYGRDFTDGRRVRRDATKMNRLYAAEGAWTLTGSMADHRLVVRPGRVEAIARALAAACGVAGSERERLGEDEEKWVRLAAADLRSAGARGGRGGRAVVVAGMWQPAEVHAAAIAINGALGAVGTTVRMVEPIAPVRPGLAELVREMGGGELGGLVVIGGDPAARASGDLRSRFAAALEAMTRRGALTAHLAKRHGRTGFLSRWVLPESHYMEAWGDVRGHDGTASVVQPLILPLHSSLSGIEAVLQMLGRTESGQDAVKARWSGGRGGEFEGWWREALGRGTIEGSVAAAVQVGAARMPEGRAVGEASVIEVAVRQDYSVWDGEFAGNYWLQELPRPFTKVVWDNAVTVGPGTAAGLKVKTGDLVRVNGVEGPALVVPGMAEGLALVTLGYGERLEPLGEVVGFDAYTLVSGAAAQLTATGREGKLVQTRSQHVTEGEGIERKALEPAAIVTTAVPEFERETRNRRLVRVVRIAEFKENPQVVRDLGGAAEKRPLLSLYKPWEYTEPYQWGMSIDQTACIGCNACVISCQAENNIPVVGKAEVARQREMHWIRIDDYRDPGNGTGGGAVYHQPVPCMHCENAPCEYVCPVGATTHSPEGLNQMTYNRCVGTRYCSNNCPYKVRRFNFFDYQKYLSRPEDIPRNNPEVTVRMRGVMEKCTYCVQRIERTRIEIIREVTSLRDRAQRAEDEAERGRLEQAAADKEWDILSRLQTACQQACPTRAIEFGPIRRVAGRETEVMRAKASPLDYSLLRELTTVPRTTYLARVTNPSTTSGTDAPAPKGGAA